MTEEKHPPFLDEKIRFEKEYVLTSRIFKDAYLRYQKENVLLKSRLIAGVFFLFGFAYVILLMKDPKDSLSYMLILMLFAMGVREWTKPWSMRRSIAKAIDSMGGMRCKISVSYQFVDILAIDDSVQKLESDFLFENIPARGASQEEILKEREDAERAAEEEKITPTRLSVYNGLKIEEYDEYFMLYQGDERFFIVPKEGWTDLEAVLLLKVVDKSNWIYGR